MRRLGWLVLSALLLASPAFAEPEPAGAAAAAPGPSAAEAPPAAAETPRAADRWGDGRVTADPRKQPAHGHPYNWRQMSFGAAIMLLMLGFVFWVIRRQTRAHRSN